MYIMMWTCGHQSHDESAFWLSIWLVSDEAAYSAQKMEEIGWKSQSQTLYNGLIGKYIIEDGNKLQGWMSKTKKREWMRSQRTRSWTILIYVKTKGKWFKHIDNKTSICVKKDLRLLKVSHMYYV